MGICKSCKEEIDHLRYVAVIHHIGEFKLMTDGSYDFDEEPADYCNEAQYTFECIACGEELFYNIDDAEEFLKGKQEKQVVLN